MVKLVIQVPCFNEESSLPATLRELPRRLPGVDRIEWLVIDDGSTDRTADVARAHGVDHVVRLPEHLGLARAFMAGLDAALAAGADVIVNTDADNQYVAADIPRLIAPVLEARAGMVVGERPINQIAHFSRAKKLLQRLGSAVVRFISRIPVPDATSGFRAFSRQAALKLNVLTTYSYTLETIIEAPHKGITVTSVPVRINAPLRPSRLALSSSAYVKRSAVTLLRLAVIYSPLRCFLAAGLMPLLGGAGWGLHELWRAGSVEASRGLVLFGAAALVVVGLQLWLVGVFADLIAVNRRLLEDIQFRVRLGQEPVAATATPDAPRRIALG